jgi:hypothetical protein
MECKWCMVGERYMVLDAHAGADAGSISALAGLVVTADACSAGSISISLMYDGRRVEAVVGAAEFMAATKIV